MEGCGVPPSDAGHRKEGGVGDFSVRFSSVGFSSVGFSSIGCCLVLLGAAWMLLGCCFDCCLVLLVGGGDEVCGGLEKVGYDSNFFEKDNLKSNEDE